jgi:uncharacterized protein (TIGR02001 family)
MAWRNREARLVKSCVLAAALIVGLALPAHAQNKLTVSGSATFTTDYMFRSISNTNQRPAVQPEFDATYGIFYATFWGSNTAYGDNIETDGYVGLTPKWKDITFNFAFMYYGYPGANSGRFIPNGSTAPANGLGYYELRAGGSWTKGPWTLGLNNYWSPNNFQVFGQSNAIEGAVAYAFSNKLFNFFSPSISGTVGFQSYQKIASDYTYWNFGLTLGFMKNWSADIRYYDTNYNDTQCSTQSGNGGSSGAHNCDARAVGTLRATF